MLEWNAMAQSVAGKILRKAKAWVDSGLISSWYDIKKNESSSGT